LETVVYFLIREPTGCFDGKKGSFCGFNSKGKE